MGQIRMDQFVNIDCITMTKKLWKVASNADNIGKILIYFVCDNTVWHSKVKV